MSKWYFKVNGSLVDLKTGAPIQRIAIIATSGVREGDSPHRSRGVGPTAVTEADGQFSTWYVTEGAEGVPTMPDGVALFLKRPDGDWGNLAVGLTANLVVAVEENVMTIALGTVVIDPSAFPAPAPTPADLPDNSVNPLVQNWKQRAAEIRSDTDLLIVPSSPTADMLSAHCPTAMRIPFADDLSHGPLVAQVGTESWVTLRSRYWQDISTNESYTELNSAFRDRIELLFLAISQCDQMTVWISNSLQDFLFLAFIVSARDAHGAGRRNLSIVFVDYDMQSGRRIGSLGELWPSQLAPWVSKAQAINDVDRCLLQRAWSAITSADPGYLSSVAASVDEGAYGCRSKLAAYLQRYPSARSGLSAIDEALLAACSTEETKAARIIAEVLGSMADKGDRIGDLVLFARLLKLGDPVLRKPLLNLTGDLRHLGSTVASLTDFGAAVLAGSENAIAANGIDEQIGGARLCLSNVWYRATDGLLIRQ